MPTVCSIFTPMDAKYTHLNKLIPRYHQFDNNYNDEYIMNTYIHSVDASKMIWILPSHKLQRNFSALRTIFAWLTLFPPLTQDATLMCECVKRTCWQSGILGHGGGGGGNTPQN